MIGGGTILVIWGVGIFWIAGLAAIIWVIYEVITKQKVMPDAEKVIWVLVALFLGIIGAVIYYVVVKAGHKYENPESEEYGGIKVY